MLHSTSEFHDDCPEASSLRDGDGKEQAYNTGFTRRIGPTTNMKILKKEGDVPAMT